MGDTTEISWSDSTFNPWMGCTKVSPACHHCYAERDMDKRYGKVQWGPSGTRVKTSPENWRKPLKWNREAEAAGVRKRVFCASLADVFEDWQGQVRSHERDKETGEPTVLWWRSDIGTCRAGQTTVPHVRDERLATLDHLRSELFALIDATPNLDWLLLTKRPENIRRMMVPHSMQRVAGHVSQNDGDGCVVSRRHNVWLGCSVESQEYAEKRIPELLKCRDLAPVLFLSCEPLLGPVDLSAWVEPEQDLFTCQKCGEEFSAGEARHDGRSPCCAKYGDLQGKTDPDNELHWIIAGGESGTDARPSHPDWFRSLRDQCQAAGVPFFFKQWGEWAPTSGDQPILPLMDPGRHGVFDDAGNWRIDEGKFSRYENLSGQMMYRVGKKSAGRLLDGVEHNGFPQVQPA